MSFERSFTSDKYVPIEKYAEGILIFQDVKGLPFFG
jgi:hypothetical protein